MVLERDFPPDLRVENEIRSLVAIGHSIILACYTFTGADRMEIWEGCRIYKKRISKFVYKSSIGALMFPFYFKFWRKHIRRIIGHEMPDAIHIHDLPLAAIGYEMRTGNKIRFILDLHENWPAFLEISRHANTLPGRILSSVKQWRSYELNYCKKADHVIVVIEEARERLIKLGIDSSKISVIANYPMLSDFKDLEECHIQATGKQILFYAGGINKHRGLEYVIKALPDLKKQYPAIECWILGDGNYRLFLEKLVKKLGLKQNVIFTGQVPYKTVLKKLAESTVTVIPHVKSEHTDSTIPHKLFQYLYAGKPVIASNCAPVERIIRETGGGITYQWDSPADFIEKYTSIRDSMKSFNPLKLREIIKDKYSWEMQSEDLQEIYKV